ncbi:MAG: hypothetical protein CM1200mP2_25120 [Planctomycetaceae bacterium]|nr:MAG: hypothetical protein CM1200mP2_25120 [Planctomycetaceae bacterium]
MGNSTRVYFAGASFTPTDRGGWDCRGLESYPRGGLPRPGRVRLVIGKPWQPEGYAEYCDGVARRSWLQP